MRPKVLVLSCALLVGCGSEVVVSDASVDGSQDATIFDAEKDADGASDAADDLWTPCGIRPQYGIFDCCDGSACRGTCENVNGEYACWCGSIQGGCSSVSTCCGGCKSQEECKWSMGQ